MSFKVKDKVRIVGGPKDVKGQTGYIGEIRTDVAGNKTYTIDYDVEGRDRPASVQLKAKDIRVFKESISFKQYLTEAQVKAQVAHIATNLLGTLDVEQVESLPDNVIDNAKEDKHKFIDTAGGPWIVSLFHYAGKYFARVDPPKGAGAKQTYFIPKETHEAS
jgi:hypothetical protein